MNYSLQIENAHINYVFRIYIIKLYAFCIQKTLCINIHCMDVVYVMHCIRYGVLCMYNTIFTRHDVIQSTAEHKYALLFTAHRS